MIVEFHDPTGAALTEEGKRKAFFGFFIPTWSKTPHKRYWNQITSKLSFNINICKWRDSEIASRISYTITDPHIDHHPPFDQSHYVTVQKRQQFKLSTAYRTGLAAPPPNILRDAQNRHTFRTDLTVRAARLLNFTLRFHCFFLYIFLYFMNNNTK